MSEQVEMPAITLIVARSHPGRIIGRDNGMPWRLKTDLRRFKRVTEGHAVVMGRLTFDSIGHPLPNRTNIVVSSHSGAEGPSLRWVKDRETATLVADRCTLAAGRDEFFVIGGAQIYRLYEDVFDRAHLTEVLSPDIEGDATFDYGFLPSEWRTISEEDHPASGEDQHPFRIRVLERRERRPRLRWTSELGASPTPPPGP